MKLNSQSTQIVKDKIDRKNSIIKKKPQKTLVNRETRGSCHKSRII